MRWLLLLESTGSGAHSRGAQAYLLCGRWNLSGPGTGPVSLALAGGFLPILSPRKSDFNIP